MQRTSKPAVPPQLIIWLMTHLTTEMTDRCAVRLGSDLPRVAGDPALIIPDWLCDSTTWALVPSTPPLESIASRAFGLRLFTLVIQRGPQESEESPGEAVQRASASRGDSSTSSE